MLHIHAILADSPLFSGLQRPNIERIAQSVALRHLKKKAILFHEGTEGTTVYVLLKGAIQIHKTDEDGSERVIRIFKPGEMFAQVILFERPDYPVTASALERSEVLGIPRRSLLALLEDAAFRNDFIAGLMQRQRYLANRIATLSTTDVEQRLREFLREHFGRFDKTTCTLKRKDVAAAIGVTPETLSRLLGRLKKKGTLLWQGQEIHARDRFW